MHQEREALASSLRATHADLTSSVDREATLQSEVNRLEEQLLDAQQRIVASGAGTSSDPERERIEGQLVRLAEELARVRSQRGELQQQVDQLSTQVSTLQQRLRATETSGDTKLPVDEMLAAQVRSLVQALEPLRWGLGGAIDFMSRHDDGRDPVVGTHVRNLKLLEATLGRLADNAN
jgi:chromosome segregation ATPase